MCDLCELKEKSSRLTTSMNEGYQLLQSAIINRSEPYVIQELERGLDLNHKLLKETLIKFSTLVRDLPSETVTLH